MSQPIPPVVDFYRRHPISEGQIVDTLRRQGKDLGRLRPEDLYDLDQDHYGGLEAVETLGRRAGIDGASRVLDVCAGLAGPARFMARRWGARVTGVDLSPDRAAGARRLSAAVGLGGLVRMVRGDAQRLPFRDGAFTAVVSQEGLLHVPDKALTLAECRRVLLPGGRRGSLARVVGHLAPAARDVPRPPGRHGGEARAGALRRVRPALRVLREAGGRREARRGPLQRNSRSRNFLTSAGSFTLTPVGTTRSELPLPVICARSVLLPWVATTFMSVRPSASA